MPAISNSNPIIEEYYHKTPASAEFMRRAERVLPGGNTRTTTFHPPYPLSFVRGSGSWLWDADGNRYFDLFYNGLSLIHGHAHEPIQSAIEASIRRGTALGGVGEEIVALAELLQRRISAAELVRFTSSGSEAAMLAVRVAREVTGRPLILKTHLAYHGSFHDLEAGLYGLGELAGRTILAEYNNLASFEAAMALHGRQVAAIMIEPVMFTGRVVTPDQDFLDEIQRLAARYGTLLIVDDCLMLRLAEGGSPEKFGFSADLVVLGKFLGGGTPLGAVCGRRSLMRALDPYVKGSIFHGGSFNGHVTAAVAGLVAMTNYDKAAIERMDAYADILRTRLQAKAGRLGLAVQISGTGSVAGIAFPDDPLRHEEDPSAIGSAALFQLACLNEGVSIAPGGLMALSTAVDDTSFAICIEGLEQALARFASLHR